MIDAANAPSPGFDKMAGNMSDAATDAKKAVLQRFMQQQPQIQMPQPMRSIEDNSAISAKGAMAMQNSKSNEANNVINRTQQDISDLQDMAQFGDKDAESQINSKKEILRKYLLNNR